MRWGASDLFGKGQGDKKHGVFRKKSRRAASNPVVLLKVCLDEPL